MYKEKDLFKFDTDRTDHQIRHEQESIREQHFIDQDNAYRNQEFSLSDEQLKNFIDQKEKKRLERLEKLEKAIQSILENN